MKTISDKIIQPLLSEKASSREQRFNEYTLVVEKTMSRSEVAKAIEKIFGVKPLSVRTQIFRKKTKQTRYGTVPAKAFKKALIRLPEGKRIEVK